jgi:hypothetical protein
MPEQHDVPQLFRGVCSHPPCRVGRQGGAVLYLYNARSARRSVATDGRVVSRDRSQPSRSATARSESAVSLEVVSKSGGVGRGTGGDNGGAPSAPAQTTLLLARQLSAARALLTLRSWPLFEAPRPGVDPNTRNSTRHYECSTRIPPPASRPAMARRGASQRTSGSPSLDRRATGHAAADRASRRRSPARHLRPHPRLGGGGVREPVPPRDLAYPEARCAIQGVAAPRSAVWCRTGAITTRRST